MATWSSCRLTAHEQLNYFPAVVETMLCQPFVDACDQDLEGFVPRAVLLPSRWSPPKLVCTNQTVRPKQLEFTLKLSCYGLSTNAKEAEKTSCSF